ncbi:MAG: hypothetical protein WC625_03630 [Caldisericia bacterium]
MNDNSILLVLRMRKEEQEGQAVCFVIPAETGTNALMQRWIPACAGMTEADDSDTCSAGIDEPAPRD